MPDDYLRTHVIDGSHWCTQDRGKTDIDSQPRITRNLSTPETREFWQSAQDVSDIVSGWPDSKRAGINVSDRRTLCAVCCRPAPGGISYTVAGKRYELCDMHPGMANHDVARIIALRAANSRLMRELHRWQTGNEIEGDYVEHWISRSDFEELEKHASDLERQLLDVTAERDRLRKGFADATAKHRVYRREIRRLQRALLAERGAGVTDELQRQSRVLAGFQARLEALEGRK